MQRATRAGHRGSPLARQLSEAEEGDRAVFVFRALGTSTTTASKSLTNGASDRDPEREPNLANKPLSTSCGTTIRKMS